VQTYSVTTSCGVSVTFGPHASGLRMGAAVLYDTTGNSLATAYFNGLGVGPQIAFVPGVQSTIGTGLSGPSGVVVDGNGNLFISDTGNDRIVEVPWNGSGYGTQITVPVTGLNTPMGMTIDAGGNLYIASNGNDRVIKLPWMGMGYGTQMKAGTGLYGPSGVSVDGGGNIYIADTLNSAVRMVPWLGTAYGVETALGSYVKYPQSAAVDANRNAYIAMPYINMVVKVPWNGTKYAPEINLPFTNVSFPTAIVVDGNANVYLLDSGNNRLLMLPWTGSEYGDQVTIASGFNGPSGLALDGNGNLYVADTDNNQVVKIDRSARPSLQFANTYIGSTSADSAQVLLAQNIGNAPLVFASVGYPADFVEDAGIVTPCMEGTSLSAGNLCEIAIDFTPQSPGSPLAETVVFTDNTLGVSGTHQAISVSGTAIGKKAQSISFAAIPNTVYGASPIALTATSSSGLPVSYQVMSGPATLNSRSNTINITGAGSVVILATQAGNATYQQAPSITISFNVSPAVLTITPTSTVATYGAIPASFNYSITGLLSGQYLSQVISGKPVITSNASAKSNAGSYVLTCAIGTLQAANYSFVFVKGTLTINKASLTVRAASASKIYGDPIPTFGWQMSGFVNGDTSASITGAPHITSTATVASAVGTYAITASTGTLTSVNYSFTFVAGTLTVAKATLTLTADSKTLVYGGSVPVLTYSLSGLVNKDTATSATSGAPVLKTTATGQPAVGSYPVTFALGSLSSANYSFKFVAGSIVVSRAVLTISANNAAMTYGGALPAFSYSVIGLVHGDTQRTAVSGAPVFATTATHTSMPGNFNIVPSQGSLASANYSFVFKAGVLTISKAVLTIVPRAMSISYGGAVPALTYDLKGFVNGDGTSLVSGTPSLVTTASAKSAVGTYAINATAGNMTSKAYSFTTVSGVLTVTKAVLSITPTSLTMVYGAKLPGLTFTMTGFVNGDSQSTACKGAPLLATTAKAGSAAGSYPISAALGTITASNYSFRFVAGTLTVQKAVLTVTANSLTMKKGAAVPKLTYTAKGYVNGDSAAAVKGAPALTTTATSASKAGSYAITIAVGTMSAANYQFTLVNGTMTVTQ
jgi:hypothetical protein